MGVERDVLVMATDEDYWSLQTRCGLACHYRNTRPGAGALAFYRDHPISAITHYARVRREERDVDARETVSAIPALLRRGERDGWISHRGRSAAIGVVTP